jgi:hypothetical protein
MLKAEWPSGPVSASRFPFCVRRFAFAVPQRSPFYVPYSVF